MINPEYYFLIFIAFIWIVYAIIQDFRKREIANWWNFSLVALAFVYRLFVSVYYWDYQYILWGGIFFGVFLALANIFYYSRVFAGGDAKLLIGLGAIFPFSFLIMENLVILIGFIFLVVFCGSFYGLFYSFFIVSLHFKDFKKEFSSFKKLLYSKLKIAFLLSLIPLIIAVYFKEWLFCVFSLMILVFPVLYFYSKAVEKSCMIKIVFPKQLTMGDWLYKEVKIGNKKIKPDWDGLGEKDLAILQKFKGKIKIKDGIPFTPAFLLAMIILLAFIDEIFEILSYI